MAVHTEQEVQRAYCDSAVAESYCHDRFVCELGALLHRRQVAAVNEVIRRTRAKDVLEVAPGPGRVTREVELDGNLTCLEYNESMICAGKTACPDGVRWVQGNAFELPFGTEFHFLYTFRFVRHFHRNDRQRLYEQFHKVLRAGGFLMLDAVNKRVSGPLRAANPADYPIYDKLYADEGELRTELQQAGFEVVDLAPVQRWYAAQYRAQIWLGPRSRWLCQLAIRTLERLRRGPALEWIVTCRRG